MCVITSCASMECACMHVCMWGSGAGMCCSVLKQLASSCKYHRAKDGDILLPATTGIVCVVVYDN